MASSLFNQPNIVEQFQQFKQQFGNGNPKQIVEEMLKSGKMTKLQYDKLSSMAAHLQQFLK